MSDPTILAAVKTIAALLPDLIAYVASAFRGGRDAEAELRAFMASAEAAADVAADRKYGPRNDS